MADQVYTIQLNVKVNDSEVSDLEKRVGRLDGRRVGRGGTRTAGTSGGGYGNIPPSQQAYYRALNRRFGQIPGFSNEGFLSNVNRLYHRTGVFQRSFLGNMTHASGWLRNLSNFGSVLSSLGRIVTGVNPAIGAFASSIGMVGKALIAFKVAGVAIRGGALFVGNRLLNNQNFGEAGSNIMQFSMARKGLGAAYEQSLEDATRLAAEYGFSRSGILNSINMFTGLNAGGQKLSRQDAVRIATQAGKISHVGNVPFERVNINLQQLLGQPTPSARDLRELIQAAPIIGKIAQQAMSRTNVSGDVFSYLKDKTRLLEVLNEFDKMIESNPFLQARGMSALYKETFYMNVTEANKEQWGKISEGMKAFYEGLEPIANYWIPKLVGLIDPDKIKRDMSDIQTGLEALGDGLSLIGKGVGYLWKQVAGPNSIMQRVIAPTISRPATAITKWVNEGSPMFDYMEPTYDEETKSIRYQNNRTFGYSRVADRRSRWMTELADRNAKRAALEAANIPQVKWEEYMKSKNGFVPKYRNPEVDLLPYAYSVNPDFKVVADDFTGTGSNIATSDGLSDITKGSRALVINFNREIVNMPITIDKVNDGADLGSQLMGVLNDNIVRGLQIALNNATGVM